MPTTLANPGDSIATMRFKEPYTSQGLNKKLFGLIGSGVVRGGKLATTGIGFGINITADAIEGDSIYSYQDVNGLQFTVRQAGVVPLDLTALAGQTVYICLYVGYTIGATTVVNWRAYTQAELFTAPVAEAAYVVILGRVVVPGVGPIPAANVTPTARRMAWDDKVPERWHQIVKNGGFEQAVAAGSGGFFGWEHWFGTSFGTPNFRVSTTAPYEGVREFELQMPAPLATGTRLLQQTTRVKVEPGQYVRGRVMIRGTTWTLDPGGQQGIAFSFYTNDLVFISTLWVSNPALIGTFGYTLIDGTIEVPATAVWMRAQVGIDNVSAVLGIGSVFFDDAKAWVESEHPIEDVFDQAMLGESLAAEVLALVPGILDTSIADMADYANRTLLIQKSAQVAGPPALQSVTASMRAAQAWRLFLSRGQLRSDGFQNTDFDIPRFLTEWESSGAIAANFTCLWEIGNSSASVNKVRFYARHGQVAGPNESGELQLTINARWDGANWNKDDTARKAFKMRLNAQDDVTGTNGGFSFSYVDEVTNSWADTGWFQTMNFGSAGSALEDAAIKFSVPSGYAGQILQAMSGDVTGQPDFHISQRASDGALIISHNAEWDPVGLLWNYDIGTFASRMVFNGESIAVERFIGAGPTWAEGAWVKKFELSYDATAFGHMFLADDGSDDPNGPNKFSGRSIAKAWGSFVMNGGGGGAATGANFTEWNCGAAPGFTRMDAFTFRTFHSEPFCAGLNYPAINLTSGRNGIGTGAYFPIVYARTSTTTDIRWIDPLTGAALNLDTYADQIILMLSAFGNQ